MRSEKQLLLDDIQGQIEHFGSFIIMRYFGLKANALGDLRGNVAKTGGNVEMVPKRLLQKAAKGAGFELDPGTLEGHIGLAFTGGDPIETAKVVFQFSKDSEKAVEVVGGRIDGQLYGKAQVETLSKLPGKDEMRAQLLSVLQAPMAETLSTMGALLSSVIYCLDNKCRQSAEG